MTTITKQQQPSKWLPRSFIDFHLPTKWIGYQLKGLIKEYYTIIVRKIEFFYQQEKFSEYLLVDIITFINQLQEKINKSDYIQLFKQLIIYLRHQLLLKDPIIYYCTIKIIDYSIRFCGYYSQLLINHSKILLKTISVTAIRQSLMNNRRNKRASYVAFDCIQAWAEAFPIDVIYTEDASIFGNTDTSSPLLDPKDIITTESVTGSPMSKRGSPVMMSTPIRSPDKSQRHLSSKTEQSPSMSLLSPISSPGKKKHNLLLSPSSTTSSSKKGRKTGTSTSSTKKKRMRMIKIKEDEEEKRRRQRNSTKIYRVKSNFALIYNELKQDPSHNQYYVHHHQRKQENNDSTTRLQILTMNSIIMNTSSFFDADDCSQVMSASQSNLHLTSLNLPPVNNTNTSMTNISLTSPLKGEEEEIVLQMSSPSSLLSSPLQTSQSFHNLSTLTPQNKTNTTLPPHDASLLASIVKNKDRLLIQKQIEQLENVTNVSLQYHDSCERLLLEHHRSLQNISSDIVFDEKKDKEIDQFLSDVDDDVLRSPFSAVSTVRTAPLSGNSLSSADETPMNSRPLAMGLTLDIEPMSLTEGKEEERTIFPENEEEKRVDEVIIEMKDNKEEEILHDDLDKVVEALLSGRLAPIQEVKLVPCRQRSGTFDIDESFEINENENIITNENHRLTVIPSAFGQNLADIDEEESMIALNTSMMTEDAVPFTTLPIGGRIPFLRTTDEGSAFSPISMRLNVSAIFCALEDRQTVMNENDEEEDDPELVEILESINESRYDKSMMEALQFLENHQSSKETKKQNETNIVPPKENKTNNNKERRISIHEEIRQEMISEILRDKKDQYITTTQQTIYDDNEDSLLHTSSEIAMTDDKKHTSLSSSSSSSLTTKGLVKKALSDLTNKPPSQNSIKIKVSVNSDKNENEMSDTAPFLSPQKKSFSEKLQTFEKLASSKNPNQLSKHQSWKGGAAVPSSDTDKNVEIKFYGNQRVVVRKNSSYF